MRRVLDDLEIVPAGDCTDSIHVAGVAGEVHRHQRAHLAMLAARQRLLDFGWIDIESIRLDIDEYRTRPQVTHDLCGRGKGEGRRDDFIAGADAQREQSEMERAGAMSHRERIASANVSGEFLLELLGLGSGSDPAGAQRIDNFAFLGGTDGGTMEWNLAHYDRRIKSYKVGAQKLAPLWIRSSGGIPVAARIIVVIGRLHDRSRKAGPRCARRRGHRRSSDGGRPMNRRGSSGDDR